MKIIFQTISEQIETSDWEKVKSALHRAIENLPKEQQEIINYHFYDDMAVKEIAKKLNRSTTHVYSNIRKAECNLQRQLNPSYYKRALELIHAPFSMTFLNGLKESF